MNETKKNPPECRPPELDAAIACEECGVFGAYAAGDRHLCADCYSGKGSCCPEFGKDDLWRGRLEEKRQTNTNSASGR